MLPVFPSGREAAALRIVLGTTGIVVLLVTIYDVLWTTLRLTSGGPITSWVTNGLWKAAVRLTRSHEVLATLGFLIVLLNVFLWVALVWIGWTLVLEMSPQAVLYAATGRPAGLWERIYFAGATIITIGNDEYRPDGTLWHLVTVVAAANGFSLFTLIVTYLLPIAGAELARRRLAVYITALGRTPHEILLRAWDGSGFGKLPDHLVALTLPMMEVGQSHLAYPVLHCVHSRTREAALAPSVAVLDEAITLFAGVCPEQRPDKVAFYPLRQAIAEFLSTLAEARLEPTGEPPPAPSLDPLREAGIVTVKDEELPAGPGVPRPAPAPAARARRGGGVELGGRGLFEPRPRGTAGALRADQFTHSPPSSLRTISSGGASSTRAAAARRSRSSSSSQIRRRALSRSRRRFMAQRASRVTIIQRVTELVSTGTQRYQKVWRSQKEVSAAASESPVAAWKASRKERPRDTSRRMRAATSCP